MTKNNKPQWEEFTAEIAPFVCKMLGAPVGSTISIKARDKYEAAHYCLVSLENKLKEIGYEPKEY